MPCTWLTYAYFTYAPIAEIDFKQKTSNPAAVKEEEKPDPTEEELQSLYVDLGAAGKPALLSLVLASLIIMHHSARKEFYLHPSQTFTIPSTQA